MENNQAHNQQEEMQITQTASTTTVTANNNTLYLVAFILALLSTIGSGIFLIPLIWMIPMTVRIWGMYKGTRTNTTVFAVCSLLFLNLISGIILLVAPKQD
jgi:ABC-type methionine transport system permease subunit